MQPTERSRTINYTQGHNAVPSKVQVIVFVLLAEI